MLVENHYHESFGPRNSEPTVRSSRLRVGWDLEFVQLEKGQMNINVSATSVDDVTILRGDISLGCHATGSAPDNVLSLLIPSRLEGRTRLWGEEVERDMLFVPAPGQEIDVIALGALSVYSVQIHVSRFLEAASLFGIGEESLQRNGIQSFRLEAGQAARIRAIIESVFGGEGAPDHVEGDQGSRLVTELAAAMAANTFVGVRDVGHAPSRMLAVKLACEFMDEHLTDNIRLEDISEAARIGPRSLQRTFMELFGISPMSYLRTRRLNAVRAVLRGARPKETKISDVAQRHGFRHLGRFGTKYRLLFGETPSTTLRGSN